LLLSIAVLNLDVAASILMASWTAEEGRQALESGKDSDFFIKCQGTTWNVHKVIISAGSEHFRLLCYGNFIVREISNLFKAKFTLTELQEGQQGGVVLDEEDPRIVHAALNWIYTNTYLVPESTTNPTELIPIGSFEYKETDVLKWQSEIHLAIYLFADRFGMMRLAALASAAVQRSFSALIDRGENAGGLLASVLSKTHQSDGLRKAILMVIGENCAHASGDVELVATFKEHEPMASEILQCFNGFISQNRND
jgi:hypothetical protein